MVLFNKIKNSWIKNYFFIIIGTTILALGINMFYEKQHIVTGGVTGLAIVIKNFTGIDLSITNLILNIPLFLLGLKIKGKDFGGKTLFATIFLSIALTYTKFVPSITSDLLLACIFGGIFSGVGLGLVFAAFATTGGTDLAASIIQHFAKHLSVSKIMFVLDAIIIMIGFVVFGAEKTMYAIISVYIAVKVIDGILEGINFSKAAFIISDKYQQISDELMVQLDRGVTGLDGRGMYTNVEKKVLFCVVSKKQIIKLKDIVRNFDESAFIIVADVREVLGEGFLEYHV